MGLLAEAFSDGSDDGLFRKQCTITLTFDADTYVPPPSRAVADFNTPIFFGRARYWAD